MARVLVKKNVAKIIRAATAGDEPAENAQGKLPDGHKASTYGIEARQTVTADGDPDLHIWNYAGAHADLSQPNPPEVLRQKFQVQAPQFSIDPKLVNTFYPPAGHQDEGRILPHIVFNDPHMPWLRKAGVAYDFLDDPIDPSHTTSKSGRNLVPWIALVVFDPDELLVSQPDGISVGLKNPNDSTKDIPSYVPEKLPADGAFQMTIGDYFQKISNHRIYYEAGYSGSDDPDLQDLQGSTDMTSIIFPKKALVEKIFGSKATPSISDGPGADRLFEGQKLMAHVRHVNTMGFPDAGVEEEGYFSVVISSRTGQVRNSLPAPQIVHLVSLEHYDSTLMNAKSPVLNLKDDDRVGLVSLYSWMYSCIPEAANFVDTMKALTLDMQPLKPPIIALRNMMDPASKDSKVRKAAQILHDRLDMSYTASRWRTATGEETVAFNRGPLVGASTPTVPAKNLTDWAKLSMTGKDYQIYDQDIGIMDLTYSSAWSLGKLAAISDSPFNAALLRFRSLVWTKAASNTRMLTNRINSASEVLSKTAATIDAAHRIKGSTFTGRVSRINPVSRDAVAPPLSHPDVAPIFAKAIKQAVDRYGSDVTGTSLYNDFHLDQAANSDWELIHSWISDCLYLAHIPVHYLFPEPSWLRAPPVPGGPIIPNLPPEALRFFYIDDSWLDSFIDGALSCANHLEPDYDSTRLRIKEVYNFYLQSNIAGLEGLSPPTPRFGFVFRSSVVKAIPDLKITVLCWLWDPTSKVFGLDTNSPPRNPVVRLTKMDDFTILCLLDCLPEEIQEIKIAQPPHQQRYAMGDSLKPSLVDGSITPELQVRILYTTKDGAPEGTGDAGIWQLLPGPADRPLPDPIEQPPSATQMSYWDEPSRCIRPITIAHSVNLALLTSTKYKGKYSDPTANACVIGLELSDPAYSLILYQPTPTRKTSFPKFVRQLWTGEAPNPSPHETAGKLSIDMLPTAHSLIKPTSIPPTTLTLSPPKPQAGNATALPRAPRLNTSAIITVPPSRTTITAGPVTINGPQFTLIFHVDYRPPPPTPRLLNNKTIAYAPLDFLPTGTDYLYDVIIAIRRKRPQENPGHRLVDLSIEMPIETTTTATDRNSPEPLLPIGGYNGPGARMVGNERFVPTLYNTTDNAGHPLFGIKLIPRSGDPDATITLSSDGKTSEASVRLAEVPIAPTVRPWLLSIAQVDPNTGKGTGSTKFEKRGLVKLTLKERYRVGDGSNAHYVTMITNGDSAPGDPNTPMPLQCVKKEGGDVDLNGVKV